MIKFLPIFSLLSFLFVPVKIFAQTPTLGTTANFVLFTTTGAIGNTGISQITGNVGTNTGAITGFGNVNGVMHTPDGTTLTASNDLATLYGQLYTAVYTATHAPALGNGDTLTTGVYEIAGNTTLNGSLILDALGNPNAVFIFKIQGTLITGAASEIKLINGTQACNVFWKVEGFVTMAAGTKMKGNVVANNGQIAMASNVTLEGRALSTTGQITLDGTLAYTPVGCGSPLLTGPAMPALGAVACFTLFSGNGTVENAAGAITYVTGDIGSNTSSTVTYNPLLVTGMIHLIPDPATVACASDLIAVHTYLNNLPNDIQLLYPAQFGNKLVLTPHTYLMGGAASLTDTVFLNAQGNPNAVFVIKVNGALTTATNAVVALRNGAQAANVFWKVTGGAASLAVNTVFKGTIIVASGAIDLSTNVNLEGRVLTSTGLLTTAAVTAIMPPGCNGPLPVSWLTFDGTAVGASVKLDWSTTNEISNGFFTIEKSIDGVNFETLGSINASYGNEPVHHYTYTDTHPYTMGYYRLNQTDNSGQKSYFKTIKIGADKSTNTYHYTEGNFIYIHAAGVAVENGSISLFSIDGRKVQTNQIISGSESKMYKIEKPYMKGTYLIRMESNGRNTYSRKVVVD